MSTASRSWVGLVLIGCVAAQTAVDASAAKLGNVRTLHAEMTKAREEAEAATKPLMEELRKAERGSDAQKKLSQQMSEMRQKPMAAQKAFATAFEAVDWTKFDATADAALLKDGLPALTRDHHKPAAAVAACKFYLEHYGNERMAAGIRSNALPMALLASGDAAAATAALEDVAKGEGPTRMQAILTLGDLRAAQGDIEGAKNRYDEAAKVADENGMSYVTLRQQLIGKKAPDIDSKTWLDGEAAPLSSLQGKVVLVDFWATWCGPCRAVMPALDEMYRQHKADGLVVLGVTQFYENGYLPANKAQTQSGGESVRGLKAESYAQHVEAFKKATEISYPFVIAEKQNFTDYHVRGIPTLAVVGRDGNIALVTVGSGSEPMLKFAVKNLLAAK